MADVGFSPAGRRVAVKVVHPELARDRAFLSRFRQEVAAARKVSGAYTAPVVDAGDGDLPWLVTALVMGPSLADAVEQQGPLSEIAVWRLAAGLAEALAEVHACGLVHRDLKPSNVLLAADGPRVIDFGISRALDSTSLTGTGMVVGTPSFMSPEQASGTPVGPASDVFSFGGVVTFAATGSAPFGDGSAVAMIYRVVHAEPALAGLPAELAGIVRRCLAKRPDERPSLDQLMEVITANLAPVYSAASFWPAGLADFIGSYQARIAAGSQGQWPSVSGPAAPERGAPSDLAEPAGWPEFAPGQPTAGGGQQDGPATITRSAMVTPASAAVTPAAVTPAAVDSPPSFSPPPVDRPNRWPRRRGALVAGIGALGVAVLAVVVVLATSLFSGGSPGPSRSPSPSRGARGQANPQPPGGFGFIPAESGTPHPARSASPCRRGPRRTGSCRWRPRRTKRSTTCSPSAMRCGGRCTGRTRGRPRRSTRR